MNSQPSSATNLEPLVEARSLGIEFENGFQALANIELKIERGEFVSIVGPSGCGKSTLLRLLAGLRAASSGELHILGVPATQARQERHRVGFVFQDANLLPWRTVVDNIRLPFELQESDNINREEQQPLIRESLQLIGLTDADANKRPHMLSGGMRMRVALARALVTQPDLLLLDEPFGALDDILRQQLNEELSRTWAQHRWTGVFVTHNVAEAVYMSQRVLVMSHSPGRIIADVPIPFDYPRETSLREEPDFARLTGVVSGHLQTNAS
ncbi:MAG: nitrate/sulfonate/bicarbonate ABC transporter ATP-binding protein [Planctomycetaceae bacterium]|nr:nitrate/sulfonate/bicarbonate ABC transporter ATP-binding protein [Planctomycetaceae bacterium]